MKDRSGWTIPRKWADQIERLAAEVTAASGMAPPAECSAAWQRLDWLLRENYAISKAVADRRVPRTARLEMGGNGHAGFMAWAGELDAYSTALSVKACRIDDALLRINDPDDE